MRYFFLIRLLYIQHTYPVLTYYQKQFAKSLETLSGVYNSRYLDIIYRYYNSHKRERERLEKRECQVFSAINGPTLEGPNDTLKEDD